MIHENSSFEFELFFCFITISGENENEMPYEI